MNTDRLQTLKQRYGIVGNCDALNRALEVALKIAPIDLSVLIMGENGVGKEVFPRIIHDHSLRKNKKYFAVNCGAIPEGTIDSELFGHEKGAFTGAVDRRDGYFTVANGGTLFLDEVGELPPATQARLLRVLETGEYIPVGASEVRHTDVRIVAATNVDMEKAIAEGKFRQDLFYRLNTIPISIPALRDRGEDALLLFRKFALEMSEKYKMPPVRLDPAAQQILLAYNWPGNVRQLKNIAENMSVTAEQREITPEILRLYLPTTNTGRQIVPLTGAENEHSFEKERELLYQILFDLRREVTEIKRFVGMTSGTKSEPGQLPRTADTTYVDSNLVPVHPTAKTVKEEERNTYLAAEEVKDSEAAPETGRGVESLEEIEKNMIRKTLERTGGNRRLAAGQLGISERTLYRKIKEYGLD
ncbi:MAG: sigma-54 dependent transcriptional regulator [Bacteroidales bacterium]|nr:sigma-54 dependent transcriptional regulator [Bacteroidales bacterium]